MLTFLLEEYKEKALKEYHLRLWSLYLGLFVIILATGCALAIPQFAILGTKRNAAMLERTATESTGSDASAPIIFEVKTIKEKIAIIKDNSAKEPMIAHIERALNQKTEGISITSMRFVRGGKPAITLSGTAATRDNLVAFSKKLQSEKTYANANLPVSSLAKNKDIPFDITIDSKF